MRRSTKTAGATALASLVLAAGAYASIVGLPASGLQINNDPPTIDPSQNAGLVDLTAGSLIAGNPRVPWAAFSQPSPGSGTQQIFVRAFKSGAWQTEGFPQSLNENPSNPSVNALAPSIDFTGPNRTVPWVAWDEASPTLSNVTEIFASRFAATAGAQNDGVWVHEGTSDGGIPTLNINPTRDAKDPSLFGGTTTAGANPAPWITWEEADNGNTTNAANGASASKFQIFVSHAVAAASTGGACPAGTFPATGTNGVSNFCFEAVGLARAKNPLGSVTDPSLNIDPTRDGIEADVTFTGPNDTVPWVVWYENSDNGNVSDGLLNADMLFAAKGVADATAIGGFHWQVVGLGTAGQTNILNTTGSNAAGNCATTQAEELLCSLDADQSLTDAKALTDGNGAENPSVAAGTMVPGKATTPWVTWDESNVNNGLHSVFVARLDPTTPDHFDLLNSGQAISNSGFDSTRPDIVFSHNTPYVSWRETISPTETLTFVGHFDGPATSPVFHLDTPGGIASAPITASDDDLTDIRSPIASGCPDDPFTQDGASCQGGNIGTPFFAFTNGSPLALFAQAYQPDSVTTAAATGVSVGQATLNGSVNPAGAPVEVEFQFGPTTSYGNSTTPQLIQPGEAVTPFTAPLTGLTPGTLHYRAVAISDFGSFPGADQTVTIPAPVESSTITSPHGKVKSKKLKSIRGTAAATLGVAKVQVAVVEFSHGAHVARKHHAEPSCQQLGTNGRLHKLKVGAHKRCTPTIFLTATGTTSWTLALKHPLPKGTYVAISVATDVKGNVEAVGSSDQRSFQVK